jgi:hypothetical protein
MPVKINKTLKQASMDNSQSEQIPELDEGARAYVATRDKRMEYTAAEHSLKGRILDLMKAHKLTEYLRRDDGIHILLTVEATENVKVRVR